MRFPLNEETIGGYRFGEMTYYGVPHRGTDYVANYWTLYAPTDGQIIFEGYELGGGNWLHFRDFQGYIWEFCHLDRYLKGNESVSEGTEIAVTGNTGKYTTNPHLHLQIRNPQGVYINPENYINQLKGGTMPTSEVDKIQSQQIEDLMRDMETTKQIDKTQSQQIEDLIKRVDTLSSNQQEFTKRLNDLISKQPAEPVKLEPIDSWVSRAWDWIKEKLGRK